MATNKILVIGCYGQVGSSFRRLFGATSNVFYGDREPREPQVLACDLADERSIKKVIDDVQPTVIINCAAYTAVDLAEKEETLASQINGHAVEVIAKASEKIGAILIHYSTDYVFDGSGDRPWQEDSKVNPVNAYGRSKLDGEVGVIKFCSRGYVFRTQWVYDNDGKNFLNTMLRLGAEKEELAVVGDQIGAPTSSDMIARYTLKSLTKISTGVMPAGIYHLVCSGEISWHGFAEAIFDAAREQKWPIKIKSLKKITTEQYPTPAARPLNSRLSLEKIQGALKEVLPSWQESLLEVLDQRRLRQERH
jgi:dTDP-4-dehydrorhamnose reductase